VTGIFIVLVVGRKAIWDRMWGLKRGGISGRNIESQIEVMQSCILDVIFAERVAWTGDTLQRG